MWELCLTGRATPTLTQTPAVHYFFFLFTCGANFCRVSCGALTGSRMGVTGVPVRPSVALIRRVSEGAETKGSSSLLCDKARARVAIFSVERPYRQLCISAPIIPATSQRRRIAASTWDAILFEGRISHLIVSSTVIARFKEPTALFWASVLAVTRLRFYLFCFFLSHIPTSRRCPCVRVIRPAGFLSSSQKRPCP